MAYDTGEKHLEEINHLSVLESIDEVFDGITSLMTPNAIMYGSTVTALLSGLPIVGDLDIAVSNQEFKLMSQNLANSVKWIQVDGRTVPERSPSGNKFPYGGGSYGGGSASLVADGTIKASNPYAKSKHLPVSNVVAFETVNDSRVQIIESKQMTGDLLEDALEVVRKVDFVFCGIAVDRYGRVLEVIPNAYSDCMQRVIRIKDYQPRLDPKRMKARFHKYIRRGWSLAVSIDQALLNLDKAQREYAKELFKKKKSKPKHTKRISGFVIKKTTQKGTTIEAKRDLLNITKDNNFVRDVVRHYSEKYNIKMADTPNSRGGILFWAGSGSDKMSPSIARDIVNDVDAHLRGKYGSAYNKLGQEAGAVSPKGNGYGYNTVVDKIRSKPSGWVTSSASTYYTTSNSTS